MELYEKSMIFSPLFLPKSGYKIILFMYRPLASMKLQEKTENRLIFHEKVEQKWQKMCIDLQHLRKNIVIYVRKKRLFALVRKNYYY